MCHKARNFSHFFIWKYRSILVYCVSLLKEEPAVFASDKCEIYFRLFLASTNRNSSRTDTYLLSIDQKIV